MDPLSATASVIAVVQLMSKVIGYLHDVKDAPNERVKLFKEAENLEQLLKSLITHLPIATSNGPWFTEVLGLVAKDGPLDDFKHALNQLRSRVSDADKLKQRLLWKFNKAEIEGILRRMERLKSIVSIALELDHFKLSKAIKNDTAEIHGAMNSVQADVTTIRKVQDLQQNIEQIRHHEAVLQWLSPIDFAAQQQDIISRKEEGTGQWFLNSAEVGVWQQGTSKTLFCPGMPGAGKTMAAAIAIEYLCRSAQSEDIGVAYVFCNYKTRAEQTSYALLASLLKQVTRSRANQASVVVQMYEKHQTQKTKPSLDEITTALQTVCSSYTVAYVVLDALDECIKSTRDKLIAPLRRMQKHANIRLLCTSRSIPEIEELFYADTKLEVRASEQDVRRYVTGQTSRLPKCIRCDSELEQEVQEGIAKAVDGMFLLARLYVDSLQDKRTKKKVQAALQALQKGGDPLHSAYDEALKRIEGQMADDASLAKQALSWITHAQRPLTVQELCHALAIEDGITELDADAVYEIEDILSVCAGLVTVDDESNVVRLVHYTTQEYFESEQVRLEWMPTAQRDIAAACLTYLCMDAFVSGPCNSDEAFEERLRDYVLLDYAACHWGTHTRPEEKPISDLALAFLRSSTLVLATTQVALQEGYKWPQDYSQRYPRFDNGLYPTSRYGLTYLIGALLEQPGYESKIDLKDTKYGRTPLSWAAENGHEAVVRQLLATGKVDVDAKDTEYGRTPLSWAARNGHEAVVRQLLATGKVDVDAKDTEYGRTPLSWAAGNGHEAVVRQLLATGKIDVDAKDGYGRTPLSWAAENGHEAVVRQLLATGKVDVDAKDTEYGRTPLSWAAGNGHEAVVRQLLATGKVDVDAKDTEYGRTPLSWAAGNGHEAVVRQLLATGKVDVDAKDTEYGQTPLSLAAGNGHEAIVNLLQIIVQ